jgi:hypothetical protein
MIVKFKPITTSKLSLLMISIKVTAQLVKEAAMRRNVMILSGQVMII